MRLSIFCASVALAIGVVAAPKADALGVIWSETYQYGNQAGQRSLPGIDDEFGDGFVTVRDTSPTTGYSRFIDRFDFTSLAYESISELRLTLEFSGAGPSGGCVLSFCWGERWSVRVPGSDSSFTGETSGGNSGQANDFFGQLSDALSPQSFSISSSSPGDAFEEALALEKLIFGFSENTGGADAFDLKSARLEIIGVVPLPAAFWLLGSVAAAGLIAKRRRQRPQLLA
ncbi:MAG: hypothetical protein ACXIUW_01890 [Roseinatronobacter sp.]